MDCGGELAGKIIPRIGVVELTQTGEANYRKLSDISFAVISVDNSRVKRIEDRLGSADGFMRALTLLEPSLIQRGGIAVVFGFGKVGIGCAEQIKNASMNCVVVDLSDHSLERARKLGFESLHFVRDRQKILDRLKESLLVLTCTGVKGVLSGFSPENIGAKTRLANMGVEDEIGEGFSLDQCLFDKKPINFALEEPTLFEFLGKL